MAVITVSRPDVSVEEVTDVLRQGLGPRYAVSPGSALNWNHVVDPQSDQSDSVLVSRRGSARLFRADVAISRLPNRTELHVRAGGLTAGMKLVNVLWTAQKVRAALRSAPRLQ